MVKRTPFTPAEKAEIESAYRNNRNAGAEPRLKALWLYSMGKSIPEISTATGLSKSYIPILAHRYRKKGIVGVVGDPVRNKHRHITKRHTFTAAESAKINLAREKATDIWAQRRLDALWLRSIGKQEHEITEATGYSGTSIRRLIREYEAHGLDFVASLPRTGNRQYKAYNHEFTPEQIAELKSCYENTANERTKRKLKALLLRSEGVTIPEVADKTGLSESGIAQMIKRYRQGGLPAFFGKPRREKDSFMAFKHTLTKEDLAKIEAARKEPLSEKAAVRLEVLWLMAQKKSYKEISAATGFHLTHISTILRKYKENGLSAIIENHYKGRKSAKVNQIS